MITPDWNVPNHVRVLSTTRVGGFSQAPFSGNNVGIHVGDDPCLVTSNRALLEPLLPAAPLWIDQQHTTIVADNPLKCIEQSPIIADASFTKLANVVCCVMTADCLPLLLTDRQGTQVAAVHAGWRGLCDGIIENAIAKFNCVPADIIAWLGPAIGPRNFEVGSEVRQQFIQYHRADTNCFIQRGERFLANIYQLATQRLTRLGVLEISGGDYCTFQQDELFFSYRRDGQTGRMASMIWIEK